MVWAALRLDSRLPRADTPDAVAPRPISLTTAGTRVLAPTAAATTGGALTQAEFSAAWMREAQKKAETACFAPIDEAGEEIESQPFFNVGVAADGTVQTVTPEPGARFPKLYTCVAEHVRELRFAPGTPRSGLVAAGRASSAP